MKCQTIRLVGVAGSVNMFLSSGSPHLPSGIVVEFVSIIR